MILPEFKNKRVTVMGLGVHGGALGNVVWLVKQGADVLVTDLKGEKELGDSVKKMKELGKVELVLGEHRERDFSETDMVLRNPAVPRHSKYLQIAREAGVPVEMDSSLFFKYWPRERIIGVTGSKGKSTTTKFISDLLNKCGIEVVTVGMEGTAVLPALDKHNENTWAVFELSSWRLEALAEKEMSPGIAVVTSLYRDHLNTYDSLAEYENTKKVIIEYQLPGETAIINGDDPLVKKWREGAGRKWQYSVAEEISGEGIYLADEEITVAVDGIKEAVMRKSAVPLKGEHEIRNALPAILIAKMMGADNTAMAQAVTKLKPLPHRLETVAEVRGVVYINDSAATIPDATMAALRALKEKLIIHLLGGSDKDLRFQELAEVEAEAKIKKLIYLPGAATEKIKMAFNENRRTNTYDYYEATDMADAVSHAASIAQEGDAVLLSPGATSFGLFKHEFDRGEKFKKEVNRLSKNNLDLPIFREC